MIIERPLLFLDLETTGVDPAVDKIVQLGLLQVFKGQVMFELEAMFDPGVPIPDEASAIHGITSAMVDGKPYFSEDTAIMVRDLVAGCDLAGYNLISFDIPMLWEECFRVGVELDLSETKVIDCYNIFRKKEERTLTAAMKFYCNAEHKDAHGALADCKATVMVLAGQNQRYPELSESVAKVAEEFKMDQRVDLAGKIALNDKGEPCYTIGKAKGKRVADDPGFGRWMLGQTFTENTKRVIRKLLGELQV